MRSPKFSHYFNMDQTYIGLILLILVSGVITDEKPSTPTGEEMCQGKTDL